MYTTLINETRTHLQQIIESRDGRIKRSAWSKGVAIYAAEALDILEGVTEDVNVPAPENIKRLCLNGAASPAEASYGGVYLITDLEIAHRLCAPYELRRTQGGELEPSRYETWLDVQTRGIVQAVRLVSLAYRAALNQTYVDTSDDSEYTLLDLMEQWETWKNDEALEVFEGDFDAWLWEELFTYELVREDG